MPSTRACYHAPTFLMPLSDLSPLSYFKELHLLPIVILTIGGALFFVGLFKDWRIVLFGAGVVFFSVGYNFFCGLLWYDPNPPYQVHVSWANLFQGLLSFAFSAFILYVVGYAYRHGSLPNFLRPISP